MSCSDAIGTSEYNECLSAVQYVHGKILFLILPRIITFLSSFNRFIVLLSWFVANLFLHIMFSEAFILWLYTCNCVLTTIVLSYIKLFLLHLCLFIAVFHSFNVLLLWLIAIVLKGFPLLTLFCSAESLIKICSVSINQSIA